MNTVESDIQKEARCLSTQLQSEVLDYILTLKERQRTQETLKKVNGEKTAEILEEIASSPCSLSKINDPVEWQRSIRRDRPLDRIE